MTSELSLRKSPIKLHLSAKILKKKKKKHNFDSKTREEV